jgi:hypothetical protein
LRRESGEDDRELDRDLCLLWPLLCLRERFRDEAYSKSSDELEDDDSEASLEELESEDGE